MTKEQAISLLRKVSSISSELFFADMHIKRVKIDLARLSRRLDNISKLKGGGKKK